MTFDSTLRTRERSALADPDDSRASYELAKQRARLGLQKFTLRPYQHETIVDAVSFALNPDNETGRKVWSLPCGSGKSVIQLETAAALRARGVSTWILTPSIEIVKGYLEALDVSIDGGNEALASRAFDLGITTPVRLANRLAAGEIDAPDVLIVDEVHQWVSTNGTTESLFAMLPGAPMLGFTATPFRGTQRGTIQFREEWGEPVEVLTIKQAQDRGFVLCPEFHVRPIVDDGRVRIVNGELDRSSLTEQYSDESKLSQLVDLVDEVRASGPTAVSVASTEAAHVLAEALEARGIRTGVVLQDTTGLERRRMYREVSANEIVLLQLRVLSVGADIPALCNLVDAQPTMSPVLFLQTYGRVSRLNRDDPNKVARVFCTNRNIERFGWLYEGVPGVQDAVIATQEGFDGPGGRGAGRFFGFESIDRFREFQARISTGGFMRFWNLTAKEGDVSSPVYNEYLIALHPSGRARAASRLTGKGIPWNDPRTDWKEIEVPEDLDGFSTPSKRSAGWSDKQRNAWIRRANSVGLDAEVPGEDSRILQVLFTALDCGWQY